ncbi:hypothetical protein SKAU_G00062720 [Synaphobranchus kaupii]|uniref:Lipase domain-containing protein n=1 Tax=Synaphobranchus kaupii TaxID=118154 RepID=A0A9Q1JAY3_SYNKA|nr:hypothetical protein SKAU_G00062720 [Synaphobranchus kaupii]
MRWWSMPQRNAFCDVYFPEQQSRGSEAEGVEQYRFFALAPRLGQGSSRGTGGAFHYYPAKAGGSYGQGHKTHRALKQTPSRCTVSLGVSGCVPNPVFCSTLINAVFTHTGKSYFVCDHQRSVYLYLCSLNKTCNITAYPCSSYHDFLDGHCLQCESFKPASCPIVGYHASEWKDSLLHLGQTKAYFSTTSEFPYCSLISIPIDVSSKTLIRRDTPIRSSAGK